MNFPSLRIFITGLLLMLIGAIGLVPAHAQALPPTPHTPDLLGIYPGMPLSQAQAVLQQHSSTLYVRRDPSDSELSLSIAETKDIDVINVFMTQPPNAPYVGMVTREWSYAGGPGMTADALLAGLRQKYGKETLTSDRGGGGLYVYWLFDHSGKLLASADQTLQGCDGTALVGMLKVGPPVQPSDLQKACFAAFFAVRVFFNGGRGGSLLNGYTLQLTNMPYMYRAAVNVAKAKNANANKAQQDQLNRANKNKPTF
ncbi:MAG TPA: hypothetical protein VHQ22_22915 [Terriglobales bacterium]|jgi:hypothetical protein|nr:hypothetical protein [Terriglobales bacterium]